MCYKKSVQNVIRCFAILCNCHCFSEQLRSNGSATISVLHIVTGICQSHWKWKMVLWWYGPKRFRVRLLFLAKSIYRVQSHFFIGIDLPSWISYAWWWCVPQTSDLRCRHQNVAIFWVKIINIVDHRRLKYRHTTIP